MSRYIVIKESGAENVLLIDKETRTVEEVDASTLDSFLEEGADSLRDNAFRGIEAAVATQPRADLSGRWFYKAA